MPHPRTGETVRAYVVRAAGPPVTAADLLAHRARNLAGFTCPTAVEFADGLPCSAIGKVHRTELRPAPPGAVAGADRDPHGGIRCPATRGSS
ncbi:hypothetical protein ACFYON_12215 [Micromonospora sp. NPDC005686]|uniref:AMP-binding enzyme n=1 Tax=unclassified Micromonospora TaxID=2617518 RepID=UPI0033B29399